MLTKTLLKFVEIIAGFHPSPQDSDVFSGETPPALIILVSNAGDALNPLENGSCVGVMHSDKFSYLHVGFHI